MYYDLHIHSALSPCADDDMTPNNIVNMAMLKNLQLIAVTDHNSIKQLEAVSKVAVEKGLGFIYGLEVQTIEEVHILCYFKDYYHVQLFYSALKSKLIQLENNEEYFGKQLIFNHLDEEIARENNSLLTSAMWTLEELEHQVHLYHGAFVIAHVMDKLNSITTQLGFIPPKLKFDGIEVKDENEKENCLKANPWIEDTVWLFNSDAHQLIDIHEAEYQIDEETLARLWG
jgi:Predicted metal-dependent phosphoesterases (PHP family)